MWKIGFAYLEAEMWVWLPYLINWKVAAVAAVCPARSVRFPQQHEDNSDSVSVPSTGVLQQGRRLFEGQNHSSV